MQTLIIAAAVTGISLLWRTYRYDPDNSFNSVLNRLPYALRKPITCGLCFTFWISLVATALFVPFGALTSSLPLRFVPGSTTEAVIMFLVEWFALGAIAAFAVYVVDTLFQVSHYYKHATTHD